MHRKDIHKDEQMILNLLEEFEIGLKSMPIAWGDVSTYIRSLARQVERYTRQTREIFAIIKIYRGEYVNLKQAEAGVASEISKINKQILHNTKSIQSQTLKAIETTIQTTVLLSLAIILILFFMGFLAARLVRPIKNLSDSARIIGGGDLEHVVPIHAKDEIGQLAQAFNRMTANLKKVTVNKEYVANILAKPERIQILLQLGRALLVVGEDHVVAVCTEPGFYHPHNPGVQGGLNRGHEHDAERKGGILG